MLKTIERMLKRILLAKNKLNLSPDDNLENVLGLDSIALVEFVADLEDEYMIEIEDDEIEEAKTVNDVINIIFEKVAVAT